MAQMKPKCHAVLIQMIFTPIDADSSMHSTEIFLVCRSRGKHFTAFPDAP
jgi:hypothetical protein